MLNHLDNHKNFHAKEIRKFESKQTDEGRSPELQELVTAVHIMELSVDNRPALRLKCQNDKIGKAGHASNIAVNLHAFPCAMLWRKSLVKMRRLI